MITKIRKRNGSIEDFNIEKISRAIFKAAKACGGDDYTLAEKLAKRVYRNLNKRFTENDIIDIEDVQDTVEKVLIEGGYAKTSKAYILYREKRKMARQINSLAGATIDMFNKYINDEDWQTKENANSSNRSVNAMNNYIREQFTKLYWLNEIYPNEITNAYEKGDIHIHDLGFLGSYCAGWDLKDLAMRGIDSLNITCKPSNHLRSFLGQIANSFFVTQMETAGAQAFSSFDTYCAPFIYYDNLTYEQVKQYIQEFIYNINMPMRIGNQTPFTNLTFDLKCPESLKYEPVVVGGEYKDKTYGEFQKEMDLINKAFVEVMLEGDGKGRVFTFPIPTLNVTKDFDWESDVVKDYMKLAVKYGSPYFANYVNSDLSPEDALSMCCRLRLDLSELRKRGGGLFGSSPLTGSIGVVTLNLPRIGYKSKTKEEYFKNLKEMCEIAKTSLEIKRKIVEQLTDDGLYPFCQYYLQGVKQRFGRYWANHFSTIGVVGMNESLLNFMGKDIGTEEGRKFAIEVLQFIRDLLVQYQAETGNFYNLEATPAESTAYRLALKDKKIYPDIITSGTEEAPYYTNSTMLPVNYTTDIFEALDLQDELQSMYTGGTILHLYTADKVEDPEVIANLIKKIFNNYKLPYLSYTPTFSVCDTHKYIKGEHFNCPICGEETTVYSRVTGYIRPVKGFNKGKVQEYKDRTKFVLED